MNSPRIRLVLLLSPLLLALTPRAYPQTALTTVPSVDLKKYGDYWIIGLGPEYRWAVVGEPKRQYLWILSRTAHMEETDYNEALRIIREKQYDAQKLIKTPQMHPASADAVTAK